MPTQTPETAQRTQRQISLCAELADLAMQLARAAAARALAEQTAPTAPPAQLTTPSAAEPATAPHPTPRTPRGPDPMQLFTRLARLVRDCITLENRLAAAAAGDPKAQESLLRTDPRRQTLQRALGLCAANHPDRPTLSQNLLARLDDALAADPAQTADAAALLLKISEEFGVRIDLNRLHGPALGALRTQLLRHVAKLAPAAAPQPQTGTPHRTATAERAA